MLQKLKTQEKRRWKIYWDTKETFLFNINHSSGKIILTGNPFRMIQDLIYNLPIPTICFPKDCPQTSQGSSRNSSSPRFSGWNEDSRLPKHKAKPHAALHWCRVGFKVTSDWEKWMKSVYARTDLQNLHFCHVLVLSTLQSPCSRWAGRAERSVSQDRLQPPCITSLLPRTL